MSNVAKLLEKKTSDTVFIIGGGESLNKYLPNPRILDGKDIIVTNNAYLLYPDALALYFFDKSWFEAHLAKLQTIYHGIMATADNTNKKYFLDHNVLVFRRDLDKGISLDTEAIKGANSGHAAINLAMHMGYANIVILGFDMLSNSSKTHWHDGHHRPTNVTRYEKVFIPALESIAPFQEKTLCKIYNINRESAVRCFEFADLGQFL